ncbi:MAG: CBS domain-containing protein [Gammaproteobacteria bacterium]|nr:CBS domain-containing protein [Gammaproteobacteria bacterium]
MDEATSDALNAVEVVPLLLVGLVLFVVALLLRVKSDGKYEIKPIDIILVLVPVALWLFATGKITKFNVAGVEVELAQKFIKATENPIEYATLETPNIKVEELTVNVERARKAGIESLAKMVIQKTEAIEFQLGHGGYWGPAIKKYFDTLSEAGFLRYLIVFDQDKKLFGVFDSRVLFLHLEIQADERYGLFADLLNDGKEAAQDQIKGLPGWISVKDAITPETNNRIALETMERLKSNFLPVKDSNNEFIGVVDRSKVTASLVIDVTRAMEGINKGISNGETSITVK